MKKRILSVLLIVSMLFTLAPAAFADGLSEGTVATNGEAEFAALQAAIDETAKAAGDPEVGTFQVGDQFFKTIQDAVGAIEAEGTIVVLNSMVLTEGVTIPSGKKVTLDLNGKVLSGVSSEAAASAVITNRGELIIKDSSEEQSGKITSQAEKPDTEWVAGFPAYANNTILNAGKLTVEGGTIENTTSGGACYAIDNNSTISNAIVVINGGVVSHTTKVAIRQYANSTVYENSVTVNDGTVVGGSRAIWMQLPGSSASSETKASLAVTGGTLTSKDEIYNHAVYVYSNGDSAANTKIDISGGIINGDVGMNGVTDTMEEDAVTVTGGTFNGYWGVYSYNGTEDEKAINAISITGGTFKSDYCAPYAGDEGYVFYINAAGTYGLMETEPEEIEKQATVTFEVSPADAAIKVEKNGLEFGGIDNGYELLGGTYNYTVSKDGYYTVAGTFTVAGEDQTISVTLEEIVYFDVIYTDGVEGEEIFADQKYTVAEGLETPAFEGKVEREGYTFIGWTPAVAETVTDDATYVATFEKIPEDPKPEDPKPEDPKPEDPKPEDPKPEDPKPEDPKPEDPKPEDPKPEDPKPEDPKPEDPKPEEKPEEPAAPVFKDVAEGNYYTEAVTWGVVKNIVKGVSENEFAPVAMCTRAQIVTFLWRAAGSPKASADTKIAFTDLKEGSYYYDAVVWAVENGITVGTTATTFDPNAVCTRGQVVTFLWRAAGSPKVEAEMPFADVAEGTYYYDAVVWATENGITNGVSATAFAPANECTRAQAITFVYRAFA